MASTTPGPDLVLDDLTHELHFKNGDLHFEVDVAQNIKIRLLWVFGEYFLDPSLGVPYYEDIWIKAPVLAHIAAIFRDTIANTPGVTQVNRVDTSYDAVNRALTIEWEADSIQGVLSSTEVI